jgi:hypothetical protein
VESDGLAVHRRVGGNFDRNYWLRPTRHRSSSGRCASFVFWRRKLRQQVRPVASNNAAYSVVDSSDVIEGLNLAADPFIQATRPQLSMSCIPVGATANDLVKLASPYAQGQPPAARQLLAATLLMDVFREAFPCPQNRADRTHGAMLRPVGHRTPARGWLNFRPQDLRDIAIRPKSIAEN